jgi:hypothetical protein
MNTADLQFLSTLCVYLGCLVPGVATATQVEPCARATAIGSSHPVKASRNEHRQAFAFLTLWPHERVYSPPEQEAAARTKDSILIGLQRSFGNDLERVLLSLMNQDEATRDPRMAQAAIGVYLLAQLPEQRLSDFLISSTSNSQRVILFDALASVEGPSHRLSDARTNVVCLMSSESLRTSENHDWISDVLDHFLLVLRAEADNGSEPARAILRDPIVRAAGTGLKRN